MSKKKVLEVSPEEFLQMISGEKTTREPSERAMLIVAGSLDLSKSAAGAAVENIPECEIRGDLFAIGCGSLKSARCSVSGSAFLDNSGILFLGEGFMVGKGLSASGCKALRSVSGRVGGDAIFRGGGLVRLETDFSCAGDLTVEDCAALQSLDCEVGGGVLASGSSLSVLGPAFCCTGALVLDRCRNFHELGRLWKQPGDVYLGKSGIRAIDQGFSCRGDLVLDDVPLLERMGGSVGGKVNVSEAPNLINIDSVKVGGGISVRRCPNLTKVSFSGEGLAFFGECGMTAISPSPGWEGDLALSRCSGTREIGGQWPGGVRLHSLPELVRLRGDFLCKETLEVHDCPKFSLLVGQTGGDAFIQGCEKLGMLGPSLKVGGRLIFGGDDSPVTSIGCLVEGPVVLSRMSRLEETAATFRTADLTITDCPVFRVLRGRVKGDTTVSDCPAMEFIGADFEGGRNLLVKRCPPLKSLNCWVGGGVGIEDGGDLVPGPAFHCGGKLRFKNSSKLVVDGGVSDSTRQQSLRRPVSETIKRGGGRAEVAGLPR